LPRCALAAADSFVAAAAAAFVTCCCPAQVPGLGLRLEQTRLDLQYQQQYQVELPDAYERLLLDVVNGDKRLFIRCGLVCWQHCSALLVHHLHVALLIYDGG
jgi:glucose-6-phosphate 1-dehydrogenase